MIGQDSLDAIEKLHRMKAEGIITEAEFEASKQRLLFEPKPAAPLPTTSRHYAGTLPSETDHIGWITLPLRRYADFTGRSTRKEFWMFQLLYVALFVLGIVFVGGTMDEYGEGSEFGKVMLGLIALAFIGLVVPLLAVEARRFHDQDRSAWFVLLNLIPYAGIVIVFVMMALPGTCGDNRFGPGPQA